MRLVREVERVRGRPVMVRLGLLGVNDRLSEALGVVRKLVITGKATPLKKRKIADRKVVGLYVYIFHI